MDINDKISEWLLACRANGNSPNTIKQREMVMRVFIRQFQGDYYNVSDVRRYVVWLRDYYNGHTPNDHVRVLKTFFGWCETEYGDDNPMARIKTPKQPPPTVRAITSSDFVRLFNATLDNALGTRNRAILAFLADTGARVGGVENLKISDIDIDARRATVTEKGNKQRVVVFTQYTGALLHIWLAERGHHEHDYVWTSETNERLTHWGIRLMLKRLKSRAGVEGRVNPHAFRHSFARTYLESGGDLATLAKLLGHATISYATTVYAVFSLDELAEIHKKHSPITRVLDSLK